MKYPPSINARNVPESFIYDVILKNPRRKGISSSGEKNTTNSESPVSNKKRNQYDVTIEVPLRSILKSATSSIFFN